MIRFRLDFARSRAPSAYRPARNGSRIFDKLGELLGYPPTHRMPNLLIVGETNNGKTGIVSRFQRLHSAADNADGDHATVPVLLIQAPPAPDEGQFYCAILEALAAPYRRRASAGEKQLEVLHVLRGVGTRMLIIDEIHHILAGHISKQHLFLNVLKYLGNELRIPLVGVGTIDAIRAMQTDPQWRNCDCDGRLRTSGRWHSVRRRAFSRGTDQPLADWLRHAHASHALDRGAPIHLVQATLGHAQHHGPIPACPARRRARAAFSPSEVYVLRLFEQQRARDLH